MCEVLFAGLTLAPAELSWIYVDRRTSCSVFRIDLGINCIRGTTAKCQQVIVALKYSMLLAIIASELYNSVSLSASAFLPLIQCDSDLQEVMYSLTKAVF